MKPTKIHKISDIGHLSEHVWAYELNFPPQLAEWDVWDYWEKERIDSIKKYINEGDLLIDIGAEQGALTALISKYITSNLILIEPSEEFWGTIKAIFKENNLLNPKLFFNGFANNRDSLNCELEIYNEWPGDDKVLDKGMPYKYIHQKYKKEIQSITIDTLCRKKNLKPKAINIDIEGAELLALKGAINTLKTMKPYVWASIHPDLAFRDYNTTKEDVLDFMRFLNYDDNLLAVDHEEHYLFTPLI